MKKELKNSVLKTVAKAGLKSAVIGANFAVNLGYRCFLQDIIHRFVEYHKYIYFV